jgi:hypothetical protein
MKPVMRQGPCPDLPNICIAQTETRMNTKKLSPYIRNMSDWPEEQPAADKDEVRGIRPLFVG